MKGQFWHWANMGMPGRFTNGMDLWATMRRFIELLRSLVVESNQSCDHYLLVYEATVFVQWRIVVSFWFSSYNLIVDRKLFYYLLLGCITLHKIRCCLLLQFKCCWGIDLMGPGNHVLDWGLDHPVGRDTSGGYTGTWRWSVNIVSWGQWWLPSIVKGRHSNIGVKLL